jgi:hypothetical protein
MPLLKILPSLISQGSFTGSFSGTGSYARRALTASYVLGGAAGSSGTSGANGASGSSGSSGASGSSGTSATAGSSGTSGVGSPGTSGSSGTSGTAGSSGSSGNSGSSGSSGGTGSSGTSGAGSPGSSGSSGTSTTPALSLGQTYIGNGSTTTYALSQSVANRDQILVNVDGVLQGRSGNYYTVSGTTLTLSSPPQNGSIIDIRYINGGSGIVTTGSLAKQTILYNVVSGSQNVITGLNLSGNKWNVNVIEEWDAVVVPGDQYYNSCSLLMHFNGTNGSTTMTDNSKNNFTVTSVNGAAISTAQSKFGGASVYFDGTNDYLSVPDNESLEPGTNNLTWEMWIKTTSGVQYATLYSRMPDSFTSGMWSLMINAASSTAGDIALYVADYSNVTPLLLTTAVSIRDDVWHHIAIVRNGSAWVCYVDGTSRATGTFSGGISNLSSGARIGADQFYGRYFIGYIDELRITKGVARYTSNFTPPNSQFYNNVSTYQSLTKYIGTVGGLNDANVDYGVQKLSDSSLKVVKMTVPSNPPSGSLSASIDRVYVNVLDYNNVSVTSSYATNALNSINSLDIPKIKSIIYTNSSYTPTTASAIDLSKANTSYITISGSNFKPSASIFIDNTSGSVVTYVNSNKLNVNVISKNIGTYPIYLMNTDGASTFKINAITYITTGYTIGYLVVAGGGAGGSSGPSDNRGGGGGGGGFVSGSMVVYKTGSFVITVGSGGSIVSPSGTGTNGNTSSLGSNIIALGGGGGGGAATTGRSGGSGGGGGASSGPGNWSGGAGSQPSQAYGGFGNAGGTGGTNNVNYRSGGGGGGAGGIGGDASISSATGGLGKESYLTGSLKYYSGGGGTSNGPPSPQGGGGPNGQPGSVNTGGGGGGGSSAQQGGAGGSGIVILRYSGPQKGTGGTIKELNGYTIHTFFSSGTFTP